MRLLLSLQIEVSRTHAQESMQILRRAEVCMSGILPTKELVQMIEERIPGGKILTTTALLLGLVAVIVGSCIYLYHAIISPVVVFLIAGLTTGKINPSTLSSFLGTILTGLVAYFLLHRAFKETSALMRDTLDHTKTVLEANAERDKLLSEFAEAIESLEARVSAIDHDETSPSE